MLVNFWTELFIVLGLGGVLFYYFVRKKYSFFKERNIPNEPPTFPFGNLWNAIFLKDNFVTVIANAYTSFPKSRVAGVYQGLQPTYVIRDPEIIYRVLIKDFSHFHDRGLQTDEVTNPLEGHLFNMAGNKWKTLRNKLTPVFTSGKLKGMYSLMDDCVENMITHLSKEAGKEIEIKEAMARLTTDVIGSCAFGIDSEAIKDPDCEFRKMGKKIFSPGAVSQIKQLLRLLFPSIFLRMKFKSVPQDIHDFFFNVTKQNFDIRLKEGKKRNDFMQLLLELREKGQVTMDSYDQQDDEEDAYLHQGSHHLEGGEKLEFTDDLLTAQAFIFFGAGFETAATSMSFVLYLLSKHPDVQQKVRQEIRDAKDKFGSISYDALKSMKYLEACINEGMRMFPPVGGLFRKCNKSLRIDDDLNIEEGVSVFIPIEAIQRDPQYFPEPDVYRPERFLSGSITPGTFQPFGDGPRICIAQRFALVELKLALAKIIDHFRIDTCPKMAANEPIKINPRLFIPAPIGGTWVKLLKLQT